MRGAVGSSHRLLNTARDLVRNIARDGPRILCCRFVPMLDLALTELRAGGNVRPVRVIVVPMEASIRRTVGATPLGNPQARRCRSRFA